ncbi:MAG: XamI family restriction endonuclease [Rivularia sp. (in: cyanobacteria)]
MRKLDTQLQPTEAQILTAATIIADRLCGAVADPIIRNAQEQRQLAVIREWLEARGYSYLPGGTRLKFNSIEPGNFTFRLNIPVNLQSGKKQVNIPVDAVMAAIKFIAK